jgi:hypothetical protein
MSYIGTNICGWSARVGQDYSRCRLPSNSIYVDYTGPLGPWSQEEMRRKIRAAFSVWAEAAGLTLRPTSGRPYIRAATCRVDGRLGVLAWSTLPCNIDYAEQCYDVAEAWVDDPNAPPDRIDIVTVLIHELGHALGLPHSDDRSSVMYPSYQGPRRRLGQWDVTEIRRRYGPPPPPPPKEPPMDYRRLVCLLCRFVASAFRCDSASAGSGADIGVSAPCDCKEVAKEAADLLATLVPELLAQERPQQ